MDLRLTRADYDGAGDYVVHNVLSPRALVFKPDNIDENVVSSTAEGIFKGVTTLKMLFEYTKNNGADQLRVNHTASQSVSFQYRMQNPSLS